MIVGISICLSSCKTADASVDISRLNKDERIQAVIEIPAGTNLKLEYNKATQKFEADRRNGKERRIDYLSYPANYGFLPNTSSDKTQGGDGDALDVLVICESAPAGTVLEVLPIALLDLLDNGEKDPKILAVPLISELQTIEVRSMEQLRSRYPGILEIIETWFLNYDPQDPAESLGWQDGSAAMNLIRASLKN